MKSTLQLSQKTILRKQQIYKLKIILQCLMQSNDSEDFRHPVDWKGMGLIDYPKIIEYPMDLHSVNRLFIQQKYTYLQQVLDDIQLIWDNCKSYNPINSWIYCIAEKLERSFKRMLYNYFSELNISIPIKSIHDDIRNNNNRNYLTQQPQEDITYQQKLKFTQLMSQLSQKQLMKIIQEIRIKCPSTYKQNSENSDKIQLHIDNMDLISFTQIIQKIQAILAQQQNQQHSCLNSDMIEQ